MFKGCQDCQHFRYRTLISQESDFCISPMLPDRRTNWASGTEYVMPISITRCRESDLLCGRKAKWFCSRKGY